MYSYWANSSRTAAAAAASSDMESSGYPYGYSFNNNPSSHSLFHNHHTPPFPSPVVNQTPSAAVGGVSASVSGSASDDHRRGVHQMDPHALTCLKLGKRQHVDNSSAAVATFELVGKKGKPYGGGGELGASSSSVAVAKCQVDGCQAALVKEKEYHRRHKVCEVHAKAAMVVVLGVDQRFCQQCSRFHGVSEFDESKRSCRRRLAGHNQRRRKSSNDSITAVSHGRVAPSLLSSMANANAPYMISPSDLSLKSSAALRELIDEHRATTMLAGNQHNYNNWEPRLERQGERQVTLDLMQPPRLHTLQQNTVNSSKAKEEDSCFGLWNSLL